MKKKQLSDKLTKTTIAIIALSCMLAGLVSSFKFISDKIITARILKEEIIGDKTLANRIYQETGRKIAGTVNREPFFQEDLDVYISELRAAVAAHYWRLYNISNMGADFWDTVYDGSTPREFLNKAAMDELVRNMVLIQQARMRGIDTPASYSDLETERAQWNTPTDEIVYGPQTLGPAEFYSYRITGITDELKTSLLKNELFPTEQELRAAFDSLDDSLKFDHFIATGIRFIWNAGIPGQEIRALLEPPLLEKYFTPQEIVSRLSVLYPSLSMEDFEIDSRLVSREASYDIELENFLWEYGASDLIFPAPFQHPSLYYITRFEGGGTIAFEDAPGLGRIKWINEQFDLFLDEKVRGARITVFGDGDFVSTTTP